MLEEASESESEFTDQIQADRQVDCNHVHNTFTSKHHHTIISSGIVRSRAIPCSGWFQARTAPPQGAWARGDTCCSAKCLFSTDLETKELRKGV
jgi:hypothetical protein